MNQTDRGAATESPAQNEATADTSSASGAPAGTCAVPTDRSELEMNTAAPFSTPADDAELLREIFQIRQEHAGDPSHEDWRARRERCHSVFRRHHPPSL